MINKIRNIVMSLALFGVVSAPAVVGGVVLAQPDCSGIQGCLDEGSARTDPDAAGEDANTRINDIIRLVINLFSLVVGVISVVMIIVGGLKYITSGGDSGNITSAKNTILYAIVGLVVVAFAQLIVRFVLQRISQ